MDVRKHLASQAKPTQSAWAKKHGVAAAYVSDVINGRREPGKAILDALGLERIVTYRRKKEGRE